ncbi:glycosyltransferase family A protein [Prochlorococcus sp. MIT 0801]|uniref:glycosyltransferase family A protein n=1 Tax=Prochlorococcus sp. MIT 0801 TaxID=1501269 RepID=UPI0004F59C74|nr:glycosyltransferase family A protein [Prochlorococcus sp. MIT 0801]AIQ98275.1 Glycosyl transferase [Prochlorococcus sp. MIT 0801]
MSVFHSLIIPTRNRQEYVVDAVSYYLRSVDNLGEVIVADNSDQRQLILKYLQPFLYDKRLKILASPNPTLSMRENWERGVSVSQGEWVSIIGDDDILSPDLVFFLRHFLTNAGSEQFESLNWRGINFSWKGVTVDSRRNPAAIPVDGDQLRRIPSEEHLKKSLRWDEPKRSMGSGPTIYHGCWKRSLINKVKDLNNGVVFGAETVDYEAGYNALLCTNEFVMIERPFSILGACEKSNSAAVIDYKHKKNAIDNWYKDAGTVDGLASDQRLPFSLALCIYFLNNYWMEKHNYFVEVNKVNVIKGVAQELTTLDPIYFDKFKDELITFIQQTDLAEFLPEFKPQKRQKHEVGWNGLMNGAMIIDPDKYADRVIDFADIAFSMLTPWQRIGTKYKVDKIL